jgi:hypothetical protein
MYIQKVKSRKTLSKMTKIAGSESGSISQKQCGGSGMFIPDPDFTHPGSRISDPGSRIPDLGSRISDPGSRIPGPKTVNKGER